MLSYSDGSRKVVTLGDDPQAIVAIALVRFGQVNRIGRKNTAAVNQGLIVQCFVLGADSAPIAVRMLVKAGLQVGAGRKLPMRQVWQ